MRLRTAILVPLLLTFAVLGGAAIGAVVQMGEAKALAEARSDLTLQTDRWAEDVSASVRQRAEGVALLAFVKSETDFAAAHLDMPPAQAALAQAQLATLFREASQGLFDRVAIVDAHGRETAVYAAGRDAAPADVDRAPSPEFRALRDDPLRAPVLAVEGSQLVAAAAVAGEDGAFAGVVRGTLPLAQAVPPLGAGPAAGWVVDAAGTPLAGPGAPPPTGTSGPGIRTWDDAGALVAGGEAARLAGPEGEEPWYVVVSLPASAATGPVDEPALLVGAALVGVAAAAALVVALTVRRELRPLEDLSGAVAALGSGPPEARVEPRGSRELRALADGFNGMVARLRDREILLERELSTRTHHAKDATIGSLSAGVAHEIKNPLTGMKLQSSLVRRGAERALLSRDAEARALAEATLRMLEVNQRGIDRIERVVASLGMLAPPKPTVEDIEVAPVAEASVALAGAQLRGRADVRVDVPPGLRALASRDALGQVLLNLVANAAEAVPSPGGAIRLAAAQQEGRVRIVVEDNGPGLPPEVLAKLGEPFFTTKEKGTGLGVPISMRIVRELGGALRFGNRPEGGARFEVELRAPG